MICIYARTAYYLWAYSNAKSKFRYFYKVEYVYTKFHMAYYDICSNRKTIS